MTQPTVYACPKPAPGRPKPGRIVRVNKSDGKEVEICRSREEWEAQREEVAERADYRCEKIRGIRRCDRPAPLHDEEVEREEGVMPYLIRAGQAAHIEARKMGGGSRHDSAANLEWLCWICHHEDTIGRRVAG